MSRRNTSSPVRSTATQRRATISSTQGDWVEHQETLSLTESISRRRAIISSEATTISVETISLTATVISSTQSLPRRRRPTFSPERPPPRGRSPVRFTISNSWVSCTVGLIFFVSWKPRFKEKWSQKVIKCIRRLESPEAKSHLIGDETGLQSAFNHSVGFMVGKVLKA
ncbi:hypothetical protein N7478_008255 [Penicillium angulare]|uniref:uncharacterized protein n=1 Tax=Penicillium angulare TaxID=116970 RepID=UPI00253FFD73|nr:uncharacterized protein N7478_008255 [Penicillium angulare]KAJ5273130.1 hypothetical protein N7478_008255 [Penicillium angulare]